MFDFIDNYKLVLVSDIKSFVQRIRQTSKSRYVMHMSQERPYHEDFGISFCQIIIEIFLKFPLSFCDF